MSIHSTLKNWYNQNKRDLPWRNSSNPYHIWVSEVILQQTRVAQGLPYYYRFIEAFPSIQALAEASEDSLLKIWQGLGYYSRARNMHKGAQFVMANYNGILPANYEQLLLIMGIGEYTASAIASIAFNLPYPVVDGNVNRVLARIYGVFDPVNSNSGEKIIREYATKIMDVADPGIFNQAVMEFGALQCVPNNPDCGVCPLKDVCFAFKHEKIGELPVKLKNSRMKIRYFNYLVIICDDFTYIHKRGGNDIWQGLFEFPLIETQKKVSLKELMSNEKWQDFFSKNSLELYGKPVFYTHQLTHQKIEASFIRIKVRKLSPDFENKYEKITVSDFVNYPVSRLVHRYYEDVGF